MSIPHASLAYFAAETDGLVSESGVSFVDVRTTFYVRDRLPVLRMLWDARAKHRPDAWFVYLVGTDIERGAALDQIEAQWSELLRGSDHNDVNLGLTVLTFESFAAEMKRKLAMAPPPTELIVAMDGEISPSVYGMVSLAFVHKCIRSLSQIGASQDGAITVVSLSAFEPSDYVQQFLESACSQLAVRKWFIAEQPGPLHTMQYYDDSPSSSTAVHDILRTKSQRVLASNALADIADGVPWNLPTYHIGRASKWDNTRDHVLWPRENCLFTLEPLAFSTAIPIVNLGIVLADKRCAFTYGVPEFDYRTSMMVDGPLGRPFARSELALHYSLADDDQPLVVYSDARLNMTELKAQPSRALSGDIMWFVLALISSFPDTPLSDMPIPDRDFIRFDVPNVPHDPSVATRVFQEIGLRLERMQLIKTVRAPYVFEVLAKGDRVLRVLSVLPGDFGAACLIASALNTELPEACRHLLARMGVISRRSRDLSKYGMEIRPEGFTTLRKQIPSGLGHYCFSGHLWVIWGVWEAERISKQNFAEPHQHPSDIGGSDVFCVPIPACYDVWHDLCKVQDMMNIGPFQEAYLQKNFLTHHWRQLQTELMWSHLDKLVHFPAEIGQPPVSLLTFTPICATDGKDEGQVDYKDFCVDMERTKRNNGEGREFFLGVMGGIIKIGPGRYLPRDVTLIDESLLQEVTSTIHPRLGTALATTFDLPWLEDTAQ